MRGLAAGLAARRARRLRRVLARADLAALLALGVRADAPEGLLLAGVDSLIAAGRREEIGRLAPLETVAPMQDLAIYRVIRAAVEAGDAAAEALAGTYARGGGLPRGFSRWAQTWRLFLAMPVPEPAPPPARWPGPVIQFWDQPDPPRDVAREMRRWERAAGDYLRFDAASAEAFLRRSFGAREAALFAGAEHPAIQSDLLRLCALLVHGGIYVDADARMMTGFAGHAGALARPALWFRSSAAHCRIQTGLLAFPPGHDLVAAMLERTLRRMAQPGGRSILDISGPGMATDTLLAEAAAGRLGPIQALPGMRVKTALLRQIPAGYKTDARNWRLHQAQRAQAE